MSVLMEFSMFPTDKGESVGQYVTRIIRRLEREKREYMLTPMGTIVETESIEDALKIVNMAYRELEADCMRVYTSIKLDIRKGVSGRLSKKVESVRKRLSVDG